MPKSKKTITHTSTAKLQKKVNICKFLKCIDGTTFLTMSGYPSKKPLLPCFLRGGHYVSSG